MHNIQFWNLSEYFHMIQAQISDQLHLWDPGKTKETLLLSYLIVKSERGIDMLSQEEEFSHLHIMLVPLLVENINVHVFLYCIVKYISTLFSTLFGQHQK